MRTIIYPGSFDPITNGHLDVAERATKMFDRVIVAIASDSTKKTLFSPEERTELTRAAAKEMKLDVEVTQFSGLLMEYAAEAGACAVLRGLRAVSDFEFEFQLALMNRKLHPEVETVFLMPRDTYTYLSSSIVKEIARLGGGVESFVPNCVQEALQAKFA